MKCNQHDYFDVDYQPGNDPIGMMPSGIDADLTDRVTLDKHKE